jgi:hypothetical protein
MTNSGAGSMSSRSDIGRDDEYAELKRFFEAFSARYFPKNNLPADRQPLAVLAVLEKADGRLHFDSFARW